MTLSRVFGGSVFFGLMATLISAQTAAAGVTAAPYYGWRLNNGSSGIGYGSRDAAITAGWNAGKAVWCGGDYYVVQPLDWSSLIGSFPSWSIRTLEKSGAPYCDYQIHADAHCITGLLMDRTLEACVGAEEYYVVADHLDSVTEFSAATQPVDACRGNPINIASGDKMQDEVDLSGDHRGGLDLVRYYRSQSIAAYNSGAHWQHNFNQQLRFEYSVPMIPHDSNNPLHSSKYSTEEAACQSGWDEVKNQSSLAALGNTEARYANGLCKIYVNNTYHSALTITRNDDALNGEPRLRYIHVDRPDGHSYRFYKKENSAWVTDAHTGLLLNQQDTYTLSDADGTSETYDVDTGKLTKIQRRGEPELALSYNAQNQLSRVTNVQSGRALIFAYNTSNTLASVTDFDGGILAYEYDAQGNTSSVTYADATSKRYLYEDARFPHALTGIVDSKGQRYATWTYDAQGRATSSSHANGADLHGVTYNADGSTTVTNALGQQTTFHFELINGTRRLTHTEGHPTVWCPSTSTRMSYDTSGRVATKTDANGNVTAFEYNALGRLIKKTSAGPEPRSHIPSVTSGMRRDRNYFAKPTRCALPDSTTTATV